MKKLLCFIFIILIALTTLFFKQENLSELISYFNDIETINLIIKSDVDYGGIFNGNRQIVDVKKDEIEKYNFEGISLEIGGKDFNLVDFIKYFDIRVLNRYSIDNVEIIDVESNKLKFNKLSTMQIAVRDEDVIIGIPMILDGF